MEELYQKLGETLNIRNTEDLKLIHNGAMIDFSSGWFAKEANIVNNTNISLGFSLQKPQEVNNISVKINFDVTARNRSKQTNHTITEVPLDEQVVRLLNFINEKLSKLINMTREQCLELSYEGNIIERENSMTVAQLIKGAEISQSLELEVKVIDAIVEESISPSDGHKEGISQNENDDDNQDSIRVNFQIGEKVEESISPSDGDKEEISQKEKADDNQDSICVNFQIGKKILKKFLDVIDYTSINIYAKKEDTLNEVVDKLSSLLSRRNNEFNGGVRVLPRRYQIKVTKVLHNGNEVNYKDKLSFLLAGKETTLNFIVEEVDVTESESKSALNSTQNKGYCGQLMAVTALSTTIGVVCLCFKQNNTTALKLGIIGFGITAILYMIDKLSNNSQSGNRSL